MYYPRQIRWRPYLQPRSSPTVDGRTCPFFSSTSLSLCGPDVSTRSNVQASCPDADRPAARHAYFPLATKAAKGKIWSSLNIDRSAHCCFGQYVLSNLSIRCRVPKFRIRRCHWDLSYSPAVTLMCHCFGARRTWMTIFLWIFSSKETETVPLLPWCPAFRIPDNITHDLFQGVNARLSLLSQAIHSDRMRQVQSRTNHPCMGDVALLWQDEFLSNPS